ncbi:MAG: hypothetical protein PHF96_06385 [Defluviitoga tunisiensis]|nr:hypothetical protein [Defluviitoga tunisiensis]
MSLFSNPSQLYFDFIYHQYLHEHYEFKYRIDLINQINWSSISVFNNSTVSRNGYSLCTLLKALFVQQVKE